MVDKLISRDVQDHGQNINFKESSLDILKKKKKRLEYSAYTDAHRHKQVICHIYMGKKKQAIHCTKNICLFVLFSVPAYFLPMYTKYIWWHLAGLSHILGFLFYIALHLCKLPYFFMLVKYSRTSF